MANHDLTVDSRMSRPGSLARLWWPLPAIVAAALLAQRVLLTSRYDVDGHAAEHLAGATAPFMAAAVVSVLVWATAAARRQVDLLVACAAWLVAAIVVMAGNLRVVDDLVAAGYSRAPTGSIPDVADHSLANSSVWYAAVAGLLVIVAWRRRGHISNRATVGAIGATVIVPPWIIPGAGVIVLVIVCLVQRARCGRSSMRPFGAISGSPSSDEHLLSGHDHPA